MLAGGWETEMGTTTIRVIAHHVGYSATVTGPRGERVCFPAFRLSAPDRLTYPTAADAVRAATRGLSVAV